MLPYTAEGIEGNEDDTTLGETPKSKLYQLTGIVVHSGQASAGHYYSFIKQRKFVIEAIAVNWSVSTSPLSLTQVH